MIVSDEILSDYYYTRLVKSCYIGIPWYKKLNLENISDYSIANLYYIGLSSGKLCKFLSCSLPVILPEFYYGYKELAESTNIGKSSDNDFSITDKILEIDSNYNFYKDSVDVYYKNNIEYATKASIVSKKIISYIDSTINYKGDNQLDISDVTHFLYNELYDVKYNVSWINLFGIYNNKEKLKIVIFGISIVIKISQDRINKIAWLLPVKKWRDAFRNRFL